MTIPCIHCHRVFGGQESFTRHLLKREGRCKREGELKASGLYADIAGVWRRGGSRTTGRTASLFDARTQRALRRQATGTTEARAHTASGVGRVENDTEALSASGGQG